MIAFQRSDLVREYIGKSSEEKPINGVPNGSTFNEIDTETLWYFDAEEGVWCYMRTTDKGAKA